MPPSFRAAKDLGMLAILMITKRNHSEFLPLRNVQKSLLTFELVQFRMLNVYEWDIGHKNICGSLSHMCNKHMVKWKLRGCMWGVHLIDTVIVRLSLHQLLKRPGPSARTSPAIIYWCYMSFMCNSQMEWFYNLHNLFVTLEALSSAFCVQDMDTKSFL